VSNTPLQRLSSRIVRASSFQAFLAWCKDSQANEECLLQNASGSLPSFLIHHASHSDRSIVCIVPDSEDARLLHGDLIELGLHSLLYPPFGSSPYNDEQVEDSAPMVRRHDILQHVHGDDQTVVVAGLQAIMERMPAPEKTLSESVTVRIQDRIPPDKLMDQLAAKGFARVAFVQEPGEIAWRGGIVDIYPYSGGFPLRLEFFGNELESIREFDAISQRSVSRLEKARIVPQPAHAAKESNWLSLLELVDQKCILVLFEEPRLNEDGHAKWEEIQEEYSKRLKSDPDCPAPESRYLSPDVFSRVCSTKTRVHFHASLSRSVKLFQVGGRPQPPFGGQMDLVRSDLCEPGRQHTYIICDSTGQQNRIESLLDEVQDSRKPSFIVASIHQGFSLPEIGIAAYTDHEIFGRYFRPRARKVSRTGGIRLQELKNFKPGDFVVHKEYGIGKFAGFKTIKVRGRNQESVRLLYANDDVLFVNVNALHKLSKYAGKDGQVPSLTRLGSEQWEKAKNRAKKRIKDIARDLIRLYAKRKSATGHAFSGDSVWQKELEASFPWQDTPDQYEAAEAVKRDMESITPMDRLVCGDVGFGKTEVAVRAAFKAIQDGKQVALLVPTTILAQQHYLTFRKRLEAFPVRVEVLSRRIYGSPARALLEDLKNGKVDLLIGTQRLVSKDVSFRDLGLLIIDEEQRFGVRIKEKLRQFRVNVDTLTLTATPIPRTLQFSLIGARDLSIIGTPPPNRQPIDTQIHSADMKVIRDAILYEINRGGQVFFIHNRIASIENLLTKLQSLLPSVRIKIGHGRMPPADLERVMTDFVDHKFDVLLSTSIVENGLDIANANTIIIDRAHLFGLAEIHQLRGRVGRSDRKAFCYLLVPSIHSLTRDARQRLKAVEQFSDLGSGFHIAMRDLDIRGAGNILGGEQSGFIADLGLNTYYQMLDEAVRELRNEDFSEFFKDVDLPYTQDTTIDLDVNASIPKTYVSSDLERLSLYRRIGEAMDNPALDELEEELRDRFGPIPDPAHQLFLGARMRLIGQTLHLPRISFRNQRLFLQLPSNSSDQQFYTELFDQILSTLDRLSLSYVIKESKSGKMRAIIQGVETTESAYEILSGVQPRGTSHEVQPDTSAATASQ